MGTLKDGWDIIKEIIDTTANKHKILKESKQILDSFSREFKEHDSDMTSIEDYYSWHENRNDWKNESGRILSATYKEVEYLWANKEIVSIYEAFLVRYIKSGGTVIRIFITGNDYIDPAKQLIFMSVLYRHYILGFNPRVASVLDLDNIKDNLHVSCDMFGVFNEKVAYYFKFKNNTIPLFVRTQDKKFVDIAIKNYNELLDTSISFEKWYKGQPFKLTSAQKKEIENECAFICDISKNYNN